VPLCCTGGGGGIKRGSTSARISALEKKPFEGGKIPAPQEARVVGPLWGAGKEV